MVSSSVSVSIGFQSVSVAPRSRASGRKFAFPEAPHQTSHNFSYGDLVSNPPRDAVPLSASPGYASHEIALIRLDRQGVPLGRDPR